jgi:hypothetical protein
MIFRINGVIAPSLSEMAEQADPVAKLYGEMDPLGSVHLLTFYS